MRTHRSTWSKESKRRGHVLKEEVHALYQEPVLHCTEQWNAKAQRFRSDESAYGAAKRVLEYGLVIEVHDENRQHELRIVVRHECDVFVFNMNGFALTYWHNDISDKHTTLRTNVFTHEQLC